MFPRLKDTKLSKIIIHRKDVRKLAKETGNRNEFSGTNRWSHTLQPTLLQHYTGTLNLRVERMLANYIQLHFTDYADISKLSTYIHG